MAIYQATKIPALALPNGSHSLPPEVCTSTININKYSHGYFTMPLYVLAVATIGAV